MVMESITMLTALNMKVTGKMTNNMVKDMSRGLTVASLTDTILTRRKKAKECTLGLTATNILEIGKIT